MGDKKLGPKVYEKMRNSKSDNAPFAKKILLKMAALNKIFQKVLEIKIWYHFIIAKPAANPTFCKQNVSALFWNNELFRGEAFCLK